MRSSVEQIKTLTVAPRPPAAALAQPMVQPVAQVASLQAGDLPPGPMTQPATQAAAAGTLELALAALALMSGIALRRYSTVTR